MNNNENQNSNGYYVYSCVAITLGILFLGYIAYLIYDVIIKFSSGTFTFSTAVQSVAALIITALVSPIITKIIEYNNNKKLETYKSQKEIALNIINIAGVLIEQREEDKQLAWNFLSNENKKVKLLFDDKTVMSVNNFLQESNSNNYNDLIDNLKRFFR